MGTQPSCADFLRKTRESKHGAHISPILRSMKSSPCAIHVPPGKLCLTVADLAFAWKVSEGFVAGRIRDFGLPARLLRPDIPRITVRDLEDWLAKQERRAAWPYWDTPLKQLDAAPIVIKRASPPELMTYTDVASALSVSYESVRTMVADDGLPVIRLAMRLPRVDPRELNRWLMARPYRAARCPNPATPGPRRNKAVVNPTAYMDIPGGGWPARPECPKGAGPRDAHEAETH